MKDYLLYWKPLQSIILDDYITVVLHGCSYANLNAFRYPVQEIDDGIVGRIDLKGKNLCLVFQSEGSSFFIVYVQVEDEQDISDMDVGALFSFVVRVQACLENGKTETGARISDEVWDEANREILDILKMYIIDQKGEEYLEKQRDQKDGYIDKTNNTAKTKTETKTAIVYTSNTYEREKSGQRTEREVRVKDKTNSYYYELIWEMKKSLIRSERDRYFQGICSLFVQVINNVGINIRGSDNRTVLGEEQCSTIYSLNKEEISKVMMTNNMRLSFHWVRTIGDTASYSILENMINIFVQIEQCAVNVQAKRNGLEWYEADASGLVEKYVKTE